MRKGKREGSVRRRNEVVQKGADGIKRKKALNILRTGRQFNDLAALNQPGHEVIEGSLK